MNAGKAAPEIEEEPSVPDPEDEFEVRRRNEQREEARFAAAQAGRTWQRLSAAAEAYVKKTPELTDDVDFWEVTVDDQNRALMHFLAKICASNGKISEFGANLISLVVGEQNDAHYYEYISENWTADDYKKWFLVIMAQMTACCMEQVAEGNDYVPSEDRVVAAVEAAAHAVFLADLSLTEAELRQLGAFISGLREHAAELRMGLDRKAQAPPRESAEADGLASTVTTSSSTPAPAKVLSPAGETLESCLAQLHALVGLAEVKAEIETLANLAKIMGLRRERGLPTLETSFHVVFTGNPGTGKTTVARILARIFHHLGLVSKGHLVEVDRSGLVGNYVGQTATKVAGVVEQALGGVLFIDEAYALAARSENDFGAEAIETLLKGMEDNRADLVVIAAGYGEPMGKFLSSNPGLKSRFPRVIDFPDYTPEEMFEIFSRLARSNSFELDQDAKAAVTSVLSKICGTKAEEFANGRDVRNLFERIVLMQANRLAGLDKVGEQALVTITAADVQAAAPRPEPA